jgi:superfamily II DNA or RNA helicase
MDIESFLPYYPDLDSQLFFQELMKKHEFRVERNDDETFFEYQRNIARFLSPYTTYDSLLLFHYMGTGKSSSALATVYMNKEVHALNRTIVLANGKVQLSNFKSEVFARLPHLTETYKNLDHSTILRKEGFVFDTYRMFAKRLEGKSEATLMSLFNGSLFIFDEVHNLTTSSKSYSHGTAMTNTKAYQHLHHLIHMLPTKKVLCLTGTPIRDQPHEITKVLNLVLPSDKQLPTGDDFTQLYLRPVRTVNVMGDVELIEYDMKPDMIEDFQDKIHGRVSYIKQSLPRDVRVEYMVNTEVNITLLEHFRVFALPLREPQNTMYLEQFMKDLASPSTAVGDEDDEDAGHDGGDEEKDEEGEGEDEVVGFTPSLAYSRARQAALMSFPTHNVSDYIRVVYEKSKKDVTKSVKYIQSLAWTPTMRQYFPSNLSLDDKIRLVERYSAIYAHIIRQIIFNPTHLIYIYAFLKAKSGVYVLVSLLTQYFDFDIVRSVDDTPPAASHRRRLLLLNHDFMSEQQLRRLIDVFNEDTNATAQNIQVVIGTKQTKEGITLKNIRQIHVIQPEWNYADISQAIGRGVRVNSHRALLEKVKNVHVQIYQYVTIPTVDGQLEGEYSIDLEQYRRSEIKDKNMKVIERQIMISSWDCHLNKERNTGIMDGSRECEYTACEYTCLGGVNEKDTRDVDYSTYNAYYAGDARRRIANQLQELFSRRGMYTIHELKDILSDSNTALLDDVINDLQVLPYGMKNMLSSPCSLRRNGDAVFTVLEVDQHTALDMSYSLTPVFDMSDPRHFGAVVKSMYTQRFPSLVINAANLFYAGEKDRSLSLLLQSPVDLQEVFLETLLLDHVSRPAPRLFYTFVIDHYRGQRRLESTDHVYTSTLLPITRMLNTRDQPLQWVTMVAAQGEVGGGGGHDEGGDPELQDDFIRKYITENPYKYYGILEVGATRTTFKIRDVHDIATILGSNKSKINRGEVCGNTFSKKKNGLIRIAWALGWRFRGESNDETFDAMKKNVSSNTALLRALGITEVMDTDVLSLSTLMRMKIPEICGAVRQRFSELDLLYEKRVK